MRYVLLLLAIKLAALFALLFLTASFCIYQAWLGVCYPFQRHHNAH